MGRCGGERKRAKSEAPCAHMLQGRLQRGSAWSLARGVPDLVRGVLRVVATALDQGPVLAASLSSHTVLEKRGAPISLYVNGCSGLTCVPPKDTFKS